MELLVSAGLVVLMMLMFATIFQIATGSLGTQRGIAENDQRARTLTTILHNDLVNRTFKSVVAYDAGELAPVSGDPDFGTRNLALRRGYLYLSENDPDDDRDDVLAFTVEMLGQVPLFGHAGWLFFEDTDGNGLPYEDTNGNGKYDPGEPLDHIYPNQPELDGDGDFQNRTASLTAAEVCYFVRGGNLYRRVMLIRRGASGAEQPRTDSSPSQELFDPTLPVPPGGPGDVPPFRYPGVFYRDFDYSVYAINDPGGGGFIRVQFHGDDSLENVAPAAGGSTFFSLGRPQYRFGHHYETGQPREFVNDATTGNNSLYIGRFVHEETSHNTFTYPFDLNNGNPYERDPSNANYVTPMVDANRDGVVDQYAGGRRRSEDILMTHVHGFDVKVWDDAMGRFVDVGHRGAGGDFYQTPEGTNASQDPDNRNQHLAAGLTYGPRTALTGATTNEPRNRVFDTWNPNVDVDGDGTADPPPFRPLRQRLDTNGDPVLDEHGDPIFDPIPVRALQVTVRYYDVSSGQNRTLTLEFSLVD